LRAAGSRVRRSRISCRSLARSPRSDQHQRRLTREAPKEKSGRPCGRPFLPGRPIIGAPYGLDGTMTTGIVSAEGRDIGYGPYNDFIQIDARAHQPRKPGRADLRSRRQRDRGEHRAVAHAGRGGLHRHRVRDSRRHGQEHHRRTQRERRRDARLARRRGRAGDAGNCRAIRPVPRRAARWWARQRRPMARSTWAT